ncbi:unnamed protein product [Closterium sp. Naga37s-1]|nr:unnamed protein product [Closterium sp. Naga37s-1]
MDAEGFIHVDVIAAFNRVRMLTLDKAFILSCLANSTSLSPPLFPFHPYTPPFPSAPPLSSPFPPGREAEERSDWSNWLLLTAAHCCPLYLPSVPPSLPSVPHLSGREAEAGEKLRRRNDWSNWLLPTGHMQAVVPHSEDAPSQEGAGEHDWSNWLLPTGHMQAVVPHSEDAPKAGEGGEGGEAGKKGGEKGEGEKEAAAGADEGQGKDPEGEKETPDAAAATGATAAADAAADAAAGAAAGADAAPSSPAATLLFAPRNIPSAADGEADDEGEEEGGGQRANREGTPARSVGKRRGSSVKRASSGRFSASKSGGLSAAFAAEAAGSGGRTEGLGSLPGLAGKVAAAIEEAGKGGEAGKSKEEREREKGKRAAEESEALTEASEAEDTFQFSGDELGEGKKRAGKPRRKQRARSEEDTTDDSDFNDVNPSLKNLVIVTQRRPGQGSAFQQQQRGGVRRSQGREDGASGSSYEGGSSLGPNYRASRLSAEKGEQSGTDGEGPGRFHVGSQGSNGSPENFSSHVARGPRARHPQQQQQRASWTPGIAHMTAAAAAAAAAAGGAAGAAGAVGGVGAVGLGAGRAQPVPVWRPGLGGLPPNAVELGGSSWRSTSSFGSPQLMAFYFGATPPGSYREGAAGACVAAGAGGAASQCGGAGRQQLAEHQQLRIATAHGFLLRSHSPRLLQPVPVWRPGLGGLPLNAVELGGSSWRSTSSFGSPQLMAFYFGATPPGSYRGHLQRWGSWGAAVGGAPAALDRHSSWRFTLEPLPLVPTGVCLGGMGGTWAFYFGATPPGS